MGEYLGLTDSWVSVGPGCLEVTPILDSEPNRNKFVVIFSEIPIHTDGVTIYNDVIDRRLLCWVWVADSRFKELDQVERFVITVPDWSEMVKIFNFRCVTFCRDGKAEMKLVSEMMENYGNLG